MSGEWWTELEFDLNRDIRHPDQTAALDQRDEEYYQEADTDPRSSESTETYSPRGDVSRDEEYSREVSGVDER